MLAVEILPYWVLNRSAFIPYKLDHSLEIFKVEEEKAAFVCNLKDQIQDSALNIIQI